MGYSMVSIGKENAIALADSEFYERLQANDIVKFQLFTEELSLPFEVFHAAVESVLDRPVFTHEFGVNIDGIQKEFFEKNPGLTVQDVFKFISNTRDQYLQRKQK